MNYSRIIRLSLWSLLLLSVLPSMGQLSVVKVLPPAAGAANAHFGKSDHFREGEIAITDSLLLVGVPTQGKAYLYNIDGTPSLSQTFKQQDFTYPSPTTINWGVPSTITGFARQVALTNNRIAFTYHWGADRIRYSPYFDGEIEYDCELTEFAGGGGIQMLDRDPFTGQWHQVGFTPVKASTDAIQDVQLFDSLILVNGTSTWSEWPDCDRYLHFLDPDGTYVQNWELQAVAPHAAHPPRLIAHQRWNTSTNMAAANHGEAIMSESALSVASFMAFDLDSCHRQNLRRSSYSQPWMTVQEDFWTFPFMHTPLPFKRIVALSDNYAVTEVPGNPYYYFITETWRWDASANNWVLMGTAPFDFLNQQAIAFQGDRIVVGDTAANNGRGVVRIYANQGNTWQEVSQLFAPQAKPGDHFGSTVAVSGTTIAVGAEGDDEVANNAGAVYVFRHDCTLPVSLDFDNIGTQTGDSGRICYDPQTQTYLIETTGTDIYNTEDGFNYAFTSLHGDGEVSLRIDSIPTSPHWAMAGVMLRESVAKDAPNVFLGVNAAGTIAFQQRLTHGAVTHGTFLPSTSFPIWVKLKYELNQAHAYTSSDGQNWTQVGSVASQLSPIKHAGIATSGYYASTLKQFWVGDFKVNGQAPKRGGTAARGMQMTNMRPDYRDAPLPAPVAPALSVFPNPAVGAIQVQWESVEGNSQLSLFDSRGSLIWKREMNLTHPSSLDISTLPTGIYWLRSQNGVFQQSQSFIKQ